MTRVSTAALVFNGAKLFIARRLPGGDMGGKWEFPGGKAEPGENAKTALEREIEEELGIQAKAGAQIAVSSFLHNEQEHKLFGFLTTFLSENFKLREHSEWKWAHPTEIAALYQSGEFTESDYFLLAKIYGSQLTANIIV